MKNILAFGEIIIDINKDCKTVGGAPLNFASHIAKLGNNAYIYTTLKNDPDGMMALDKLRENGVREDYILPSDLPTGNCIINDSSSLGYVISENAAFHHIPYKKPHQSFDVLYFGTLAQSGQTSKNTLEQLLKNRFEDIYFDINIRQHYYTEEIINSSLSACTIYKASRDDIKAIGYEGSHEEYCISISKKYPSVKIVIITLDSDGAMLYSTKEKRFIYKEAYPMDFVSSVGAGDGFSACFLHNYLNGKSLDACLDRACYMGGYVAANHGAIPNYTEQLILKIKD